MLASLMVPICYRMHKVRRGAIRERGYFESSKYPDRLTGCVPFCSLAIRANWNRLITQRPAIRRFRGLSSSSSSSLSCYMQRARTDRVSPAINETRGGASLSLIARSRVSSQHTNSAARSCGEIPRRGNDAPVSHGILVHARQARERRGSCLVPPPPQTLKNYNNNTPGGSACPLPSMPLPEGANFLRGLVTWS